MNMFSKSQVSSDDQCHEEDKTSSLSDDLLCRILSFLPTCYSVRTSACSKRWRQLWTCVQTLHFDDRLLSKQYWLNGIGGRSIVNQILLSRDISMPILKLYLHCSRVDRDMINALLYNCPLLEELVIEVHRDCSSEDKMNKGACPEIVMRTSKRLSIRLSFRGIDTSAYQVNFLAPALGSLDIIDHNFPSYEMGFLPCSINEVKIDVMVRSFSYADHAMQLLSKVAHAKHLSLSASTLCILNSARGMDLPAFPNLTRLELDVYNAFGWSLVIELLKASPRLQTFILRKKPEKCWHCLDAPSWSPEQFAPICLILHTEVIEIAGFNRGQQDELELLKYLCMNAKVLDKLIIDSLEVDPRDDAK